MPRRKKEIAKDQTEPKSKGRKGKVEMPTPASPTKEQYIYSIGRRKEATAVLRLYPSGGEININGKMLEEYFPQKKFQDLALSPFSELKLQPLRAEVMLRGGGVRGQAEALRLAISKALATMQPEFRARLRAIGFLTRDSRVKERRKYGLKKARRAPQWQKR